MPLEYTPYSRSRNTAGIMKKVEQELKLKISKLIFTVFKLISAQHRWLLIFIFIYQNRNKWFIFFLVLQARGGGSPGHKLTSVGAFCRQNTQANRDRVMQSIS